MSQDATKKELFAFLSTLRDGVMAYDQIVEAWQKLGRLLPAGEPPEALALYKERAALFHGLHDQMQHVYENLSEHAADLPSTLADLKPVITGSLQESLIGVSDSLMRLENIESDELGKVVRNLKTARGKLESALGKGQGQSLPN